MANNSNASCGFHFCYLSLQKDLNIMANDLKRIERMIAENTDIIINRWYELFKTADEDNK